MKFLSGCLCFLMVTGTLQAEELIYENFDNVPGSMPVTALPNWTCAPGDLPGIITNSQAFSPNYAVELPIPSGAGKSSMGVTNSEEYTWTADDCPVVRFSARIFMERSDQTINWLAGSSAGNKWTVTFDGATGHIFINGADSGTSVVTGRFAHIVLYYDMPGNKIAMNYDGRNISGWLACGGAADIKLDHAGFQRMTAGSGRVFIDNFSITTFQISTVGWWRFEDGVGNYHEEYTGRFFPASRLTSPNRSWTESLAGKVRDPAGTYHNNHAYAGPLPTFQSSAGFQVSNWTVEGIIQIATGAVWNCCLIDVEDSGSSKSAIDISWLQNDQYIGMNLHDNNDPGSGSENLFDHRNKLPRDGQPHHFAVVKTNENIVVYVDYKPMSTNHMMWANGIFTFASASQLSVGVTINHANNTSSNHVYDEIRFSCKALQPEEFLHMQPESRAGDYDGDGKADIGIFRSAGCLWVAKRSGDGTVWKKKWGIAGDVPVTGDYDADGISDLAIFRPATCWWVGKLSSDGSIQKKKWGIAGDIPVPGDYDGDGRTDLAIFRPSSQLWVARRSSDETTKKRKWGIPGDIPVPGDYDGDGIDDLAVFRPSTGWWFVLMSSNGSVVRQKWGVPNNDWAFPADYDGDGKTDFAIFREATQQWVVRCSSDGSVLKRKWGIAGDIPVPADYDGDGKADIGIFRPSTRLWVIRLSATGTIKRQRWGVTGDEPLNRQFWIYKTLMP